MRKVKFAGIWFISIALLLSSVTGWTQNAQVCHQDRVTVSFIGAIKKTVIESDIPTLDTGFEEGGYKFYYHPFGFRLITTMLERLFSGEKSTFLNTYIGPVFEDCCNCGDDENAGYQLKIYSKDQNPTFPIFEKFDKPILIIQGFDVNYKGLGEKEQFNFDQFQGLLDSVFDENDTDRLLSGETGLLRQMYDEGYDIALVLFKNPNIAIQTNAQVTLQALRWLEGHTEAREGTEPVVIGPSMGGLVARYALQLAGLDFSTSGIRCRLFIAFDSPNRGAEVPMSLQATLRYLRDQQTAARVKFTNLNSPVARQMLLSLMNNNEYGDIKHKPPITDYESHSTEHGRFMKEINEPGFLAQIKNITHRFAGAVTSIHTAAIINGSKTGLDLNLPPDFRYGAMEYFFSLDLFLDTPNARSIKECHFH